MGINFRTEQKLSRAQIKTSQALPFFKDLYGQCNEGWLSIWTKDHRHTKSFNVSELEDMVRYSEFINDDVYFTVCPRATKPLEYKVGRTRDTRYMPCLWLDIDCREGKTVNHKHTNLPDLEKPRDMEFLNSLLKPSYKVFTGNGYHYYWLLYEPLLLDSLEKNDKANKLSAAFQRTFRAKFSEKGFYLDSTWDLARVLRVPYTYNQKNNKECIIQESNPNIFYTIDQIKDYIAENYPKTEKKKVIISKKAPPQVKTSKTAATNPIKKANAPIAQTLPLNTPVSVQSGIKISTIGKVKYLQSCRTTTKINLKSLINFKSHIYKRCKHYAQNQNEITSDTCYSLKSKGLCQGCVYSSFVKSPTELIRDFETANGVQFDKKTELIKQYDETKKVEIKLPLPANSLVSITTEAKYPDFIEMFISQLEDVLAIPKDYVESLFIGFASVFAHNIYLKIKNDWILSPSLNLILTGNIEQKRDLCFKFFLNLLNNIELEEQKKYKRAKIYTDNFNLETVNTICEDNPCGISVILSDDFTLNDDIQEGLYFKIRRLQKQSAIKSILLNANTEQLKDFIKNPSKFQISDFMVINTDAISDYSLSNNDIDEKIKETMSKLFYQLYCSKELIFAFSDKSFEYYNKEVILKIIEISKNYNDPIIQNLFFTSIDNIAKIALLIQAIKQKSGGYPDNEISLSAIELAHKTVTKYLIQTLKFMDIEVPESKTLVIQKETTPQIKYKNIVNFENETFDAKIFADFPLELDKLLSWVGYRKNVRELKDWNIFKPRDVAQANVTGLRHSEKARILLDKAKDHGIGIWNYDKTLFCIFEDVVLN